MVFVVYNHKKTKTKVYVSPKVLINVLILMTTNIDALKEKPEVVFSWMD